MKNEQAIYLLKGMRGKAIQSESEALDMAIEVLSAQPEIIRCKDCKKYDTHDHRCKHWNHGVVVMDWCSRAERKDNETD